MPDVQARRRSQRELREGMGPRRLAERSTDQHMRELRWQGGAACLARRLALAIRSSASKLPMLTSAIPMIRFAPSGPAASIT